MIRLAAALLALTVPTIDTPDPPGTVTRLPVGGMALVAARAGAGCALGIWLAEDSPPCSIP